MLNEATSAKSAKLLISQKTLQLVERNSWIEVRVRVAAEHLHVMSEVDQRLAQVPDVHTLAPAVLLAAVGQQGDAQGLVHGAAFCCQAISKPRAYNVSHAIGIPGSPQPQRSVPFRR